MQGKTSKNEERACGDREFRVTCLNPTNSLAPTKEFVDGMAYEYDSISGLICGHGHGMTVDEMNENIIWKGRPYIHIGYCKYCYTEDTVGVLDDQPELIGLTIILPDATNPLFQCAKLPKPLPVWPRKTYVLDSTSKRGLTSLLPEAKKK